MDWAAWLKEYGSRLFLYARQQVRDDGDAEDVMQEALIQLVRAVESGSFRGERSRWPSFVYTAIRHLAVDRVRRDNVFRDNLRRYHDQQEEGAYPEPWLQSAADDAYLRRQVEDLLKTIPGEFSEVVVLHIWGEFTFAEIAEMTYCNPSTVASRYRYALKALRNKLKEKPITDHEGRSHQAR